MAVASTRISTLNQSIPFVDDKGRLTNEAARRLNDSLKAATDLAAQAIATTADLAEQLALITAAQTAAADAQTTADGAVPQNAGPPWADATGTASRTAYASYAAPAISATYVQAEVQAIADALALWSPHGTALINDLKANGAIT